MNAPIHKPIIIAGLQCGCPSCMTEDEREDARIEVQAEGSHHVAMNGGFGIIVRINGQPHLVCTGLSQLSVLSISDMALPTTFNGTPIMKVEVVDTGDSPEAWLASALTRVRPGHDVDALKWLSGT